MEKYVVEISTFKRKVVGFECGIVKGPAILDLLVLLPKSYKSSSQTENKSPSSSNYTPPSASISEEHSETASPSSSAPSLSVFLPSSPSPSPPPSSTSSSSFLSSAPSTPCSIPSVPYSSFQRNIFPTVSDLNTSSCQLDFPVFSPVWY